MTDDARHEDRPWEASGAVRRDSEQHRGRWLLVLGTTALASGGLSALLTASMDLYVCGASYRPLLSYPSPSAIGMCLLVMGVAWWTGLLALVAGVPGCLMAREDARKMRLGRMDPAGLSPTERAGSWARVGAALGGACLVMGPAVYYSFTLVMQ